MSALEALQSCLAAEHAAVYGYAVLGGELEAFPAQIGLRTDADNCYAEHRTSRDSLRDLIAGLGATPVAAEAAYDVGTRVDDVTACQALARTLEQRTGYVYALAIAQTVGRSRDRCAAELTSCTLRLLHWGGEPESLPGLTEP